MFGKSFNQSATALLSMGALVLLALAGSLAVTAQPRNQSYGLGMPRTAGTGGATRGNLPQVVMIVPDDGARTISDRPTLYWYIPQAPATTTVFVRSTHEQGAKTVYRFQGNAPTPGLYRLTLPENVKLIPGTTQRWQVRWQDSRGGQADIAAAIRLEVDPKVTSAIAKAKTELEKARIYAANLYWYDAFDSYTRWLEANPNDKVAMQERAELLKVGFSNSATITPDLMDKLLTSLQKGNAQQLAVSVSAQ